MVIAVLGFWLSGVFGQHETIVFQNASPTKAFVKFIPSWFDHPFLHEMVNLWANMAYCMRWTLYDVFVVWSWLVALISTSTVVRWNIRVWVLWHRHQSVIDETPVTILGLKPIYSSLRQNQRHVSPSCRVFFFRPIMVLWSWGYDVHCHSLWAKTSSCLVSSLRFCGHLCWFFYGSTVEHDNALFVHSLPWTLLLYSDDMIITQDFEYMYSNCLLVFHWKVTFHRRYSQEGRYHRNFWEASGVGPLCMFQKRRGQSLTARSSSASF